MFSPSQWIGFCEIARWVRLHEAQRLEIALLSDSAVQARFARAFYLSAVRREHVRALEEVARGRRIAPRDPELL